MSRCQHRLRRPPAFPGWWLRLSVAVWFIFCVNFVPIHLAVETHLNDLSAEPISTGLVCSAQDGHDDDDHHDPHLASDHSLRVVPQSAVSFVGVEGILAATSVVQLTPQTFFRLFLTERQNPPGIPPPDPLQPRAPPLS